MEIVKKEIDYNQEDCSASTEPSLYGINVPYLSHQIEIKQEHDETPVIKNEIDICSDDEAIPIKQEHESVEMTVNNENTNCVPIDSSPKTSLPSTQDNKMLEIQKTVTENETTVYRCPMCDEIFKKLTSYKEHKKKHYIEKRRCNLCNKVLQSIGKLEEHMNKHLGLKPYKCDECDKSFVTKHHVKLHKDSHSTEFRYTCKRCPKQFRTKGSLRSHQVVHNVNTEEFKCKVCSVDCQDAATYKAHISEHGKKEEIQCGVCNKTFKTDRGLEAHLSTHKELKFPCEYCGKIYNSMYRIKRHTKRAHAPINCEECNEIFYERALYTKHRKEQHSIKHWECEYCQKVFDKQKNVTEHIRLQHKQDGEMKKCPICDKEFINKALLKNHVKTHDKTFQCTICRKVFSNRSNLEIHSVTHSGAKNYQCEICLKYFASKTSVKYHRLTHTDERNFQCDLCDKNFKTNRRLYVHKLCHATEEKFECEVCHQRFRVKQYLRLHMYRHSKVKPFECEVCHKRFKHKKTRDKHMAKGNHKQIENTHDCSFCDETFATPELLLEHVEASHSEESSFNDMNEYAGENMEVDDDYVDKSEKIAINNIDKEIFEHSLVAS